MSGKLQLKTWFRVFAAAAFILPAAGLGILVLLIPGMKDTPPVLDYISSAHDQAILFSLILFFMASIFIRRKAIIVVCVLLPAIFWFLSFEQLPVAPRLKGHSTSAPIRLMTLNARADVDTSTDVYLLINEKQPDIICFQESEPYMLRLAETLSEEYPYQVRPESGFGWSTMIISRFPLDPVDQAPRRVMARYEQGSLQSAVIHLPDGDLLVGCCHIIRGNQNRVIWKAGNRGAFEVADRLGKTAAAMKIPALLAGDFNGGPFSIRGRNVRKSDFWLLAQRPTYQSATWPAFLPAFLRVQPDQIYVTSGIFIADQYASHTAGSDHRPLFVDFTLSR